MPGDIQFLFGQFVPRCAHKIDKHFADYCVLQYLHGGAVELSIDAKRFELTGRCFWSSYPGPRIRFAPLGPNRAWMHRYLAFRGDLLEDWKRQGIFPIDPQPLRPDADYAQRFDDLLQLSRRDDVWGQSRARLLLETILTQLAEARAQPHATPAWLETVLPRMQEVGAAPSGDTLALESGMSPRAFRRRFGAAMGCSPHQYVIGCRVGHAKELLGGTDLPIKKISEQLGYRDVTF